MSTDVYSSAELRPHEQRLRDQEALLVSVLTAAAGIAPALAEHLAAAGVDPGAITLARLRDLPILRKDTLPGLQAGRPPFGGWLGVPVEGLRRIFVSPGPIFDPEGRQDDYWGFAPALCAAGFRSGQMVVNAFSHHLTPAGSMFDGAFGVLGCVAVPTGTGNTEIQVKTLLDLRAEGFVGTPSFLAAVLQKMREAGSRSPLRVAFVSGEPLSESLRAELEETGVRVSQGYATGDVGLIAYECAARSGLHLADRVIVELVDPLTGIPVGAGDAGEVAVTFLDATYPLLRLGTGDLSRMAAGSCPCGRTAPRLERILGRVGDAVKVRGIFLHPSDLDRAMGRHPEVARHQAVVTRTGHSDVLAVRVEISRGDVAAVRAAVADSVREHTRLRAEVAVVPDGTIPPDAKRIDDQRTWD